MIKGVVFDMDGTLVDTEPLKYESFRKILQTFGHNLSLKEYLPWIGKAGFRDYLIKRFSLPISHEELTRRYKEEFRKEMEKEIRIMHYSKEIINFFFKKEFRIAICTSSHIDETLIKIRRLGFNQDDFILVCNELVKKRKPHPGSYQMCSRLLDLRPSEILAFEDTHSGVISAKTAGCFTIAIPNEWTLQHDFSRADKIFKNFKEAKEWIEKSLI